MPLVGIVAPKRDIQAIKSEIKQKNIEIIEITKDSIENIRNVKFSEIIFVQNIDLKEQQYKYINQIISNTKYLIINEDIEIDILKKIEVKEKVKIITFGFNSKATITISSVKEEKVIVCIQRNIEVANGEILENQEKQIILKNSRKIYNKLIVFIIKEVHKG